jgi:Superinfection immunity protein/zinc-ribbon domain
MIASVAAGSGVLILALYLVPSIIGFSRNMPNKGIICVINVFLGWTFIGWVVALAWACKAKVPVTREVKVNLGLTTTPDNPIAASMYSTPSAPSALANPESVAFCPSCGDKAPPDARFCKACGANLTTQ